MSNMSKKDEYRRLAAASLNSAAHSRDHAAKARLLVMAEAWLALADRTGRIATRHVHLVGDHPLVRRMPADEQPDAE